MPLTPGTKLGPYEILAPLGAGGMGEVYRARDTRLGRDVAVKVLPEHLSSNSEVRARFEREAKTVSSLNHPYICTLFDIGREGDTDYLVMELVEGETLAARLTKGPLPAADVLKLGAQVADALDRAHRAGVVHRDLKPGNIMLTKSGAKLMDFGLARATGLAGPGSSGSATTGLSHSPTMAQPLTAEGTIVGTFQYMAPEQLEGKETDARSDIWALGCVLYEMTTGKRAFEGATQASLISSIMRDQPRAMSELSPLSPPALERLVRQCLAKDPDERWQTAGDVRRELEWISGSSSQSAAPAIARRRGLSRGTIGLVSGIVIAAAAIVFSFGPGRKQSATGTLMRFGLEAPRGTTLAQPAELALSPDGTMLALVASDSVGKNSIYIRPLASAEARVLPGTEGGSIPFWSPDSRTVGFFSGGKLRKIAVNGTEPVALCDAPDGRGGAWSRDGVIVFAPNSQGPIARVSENGGDSQPVTTINAKRGERGHRYPQFLPDGKHFLYVAVGAGETVITYRASIDGGDAQEICQGGSEARWAEPGYLLFLDSGVNSPRRRLLAQRVDPGTLHATGDRELVLGPVSASNFGYANVTSDARNTLVVQHWSDAHESLEWVDRRGVKLGTAVDDLSLNAMTLSPDGERLAYAGADPQDLFVLDLKSGVSTRLTFENKSVSNIVWSPDGRTLAFSRLSSGWQVYTKSADGAGPDSLLFHGPAMFNFANSWSEDGRWVIAQCADSSGNRDLWKVPMPGGGRPEVYQRTPGTEQGGSISPDGKWLLYQVTEGEQTELYVQSFPTPGSKYQVAIKNPLGAVWSRKGDSILAGAGNNELYCIDVSTQGGFRQGATHLLFHIDAALNIAGVAPGEQKFLMGRVKDVSSLSRIEIVLNWPLLLDHSK
jgi:Tol biopolymer transport system component